MLRRGQRVLTGDVELIEAHIMQEHVDAAQVVCGDIDFLTEEAIADGVVSQHFFCFEQKGSRAASGIP